MGYLHHARYFEYFEMGRTELLRSNGLSYREMEQNGFFYVVAKLECRYKAPAHYDDVLTLITRTEKFTRVRVDHLYRLERAGKLLCEAGSTLVCVGPDGRPLPLPEDLYNTLAGMAPPPTNG